MIGKDGIERIDGLTREETSARIEAQERYQIRRSQRLVDNHLAGRHDAKALKCKLCRRSDASQESGR